MSRSLHVFGDGNVLFDLCLLCSSAGGGLSAFAGDCLKFLAGAVSPVLFGTQGTQVLGPEFLVDPLLTRMSL